MWTVIWCLMKLDGLEARSACADEPSAILTSFGRLSMLAGATVLGLEVTEMSGAEPTFEGIWQLQSIDSKPVAAASGKPMPFLEIIGKAIQGYDGCNRFLGSLDRPGAIKMTRRACSSDTLRLPLDMSNLDTHLRSSRRQGALLTVPARSTYPASTYALEVDAEPGAQPSSPSTDQSRLPDPHKRADFEAVRERNRAKINPEPSPSGSRKGQVSSKGVTE